MSPRNTKFYFDPIDLTFLPIYYDGNVNILTKDLKSINNNNDNKRISFQAKIGSTSSIKKIKKLNLKKLSKELSDNGLELSNKDLVLVQQKIIKNLENINKVSKSEKNFRFIKAHFSKYIKGNENKRLVFFNYNLEEIKVCEFKNNKCNKENLSIKELSLLFSGRLIKNNNFYIFISNNYDDYLDGIFLDNSKNISNDYDKMWIDDTEILYTKGININRDDKNKKISFIQKNQSQIVLFRYGKIENWEINFFGKEINNSTILQNLYSGCINFYNVELISVSLKIENTACNDSVNFIKSSGNIEKLDVRGAKIDAVDFDFSNIRVGKATILNAKNDCIDMSYGSYTIDQLNVNNCGDKGISVGEKSDFIGNKINIKNSLIALATKDSSSSRINTLKIKGTELCAAAYRKKQEFYGAYIVINNFSCNKKKIYYQGGSNLRIIDEF